MQAEAAEVGGPRGRGAEQPAQRLHQRALRARYAGSTVRPSEARSRGGRSATVTRPVSLQRPVLLLATDQRDAVPRVPAPQLRGPVGVVGEQEVVHRVPGAHVAPLEVRAHEHVDARGVRGGTLPPGRLVEHGRVHPPSLTDRTLARVGHVRIARFTTGDDPQYGVVTGELDEYGQPDEDSMVVALAGDPLYVGIKLLDQEHKLADVRLLAPVLPRSKVVGIGRNYAAHAAEIGNEVPKRAADVPQAEHQRGRPRRPGVLPAAEPGRALRGRARGRDRADLPRRPGREGHRRHPRLHGRQRRHRPRPPAQRRPVHPGQGLRLVLPARPVDRDRPRPAATSSTASGADPPQRRPRAGRHHQRHGLRHPRPGRARLAA